MLLCAGFVLFYIVIRYSHIVLSSEFFLKAASRDVVYWWLQMVIDQFGYELGEQQTWRPHNNPH